MTATERSGPNPSAWLDHLYYDLGKQQPFKLFILKPDCKTSRYNYLAIAAKPLLCALLNNRTILCTEIVIDLDRRTFSDGRIETRELRDRRFADVCERLRRAKHQFRAYFTGSNGWHIHIHLPHIAFMTPSDRKDYRERFIRSYGLELEIKASDNSPIAIEHRPHWKTGNTKTLVIDTMED